VAIYGAACSSCLSENERLERVSARAASFEDREAVANLLFSQLIAVPTESLLNAGPPNEAKGKLYHTVREILQHAMCMHDAEKIILAARELNTQA